MSGPMERLQKYIADVEDQYIKCRAERDAAQRELQAWKDALKEYADNAGVAVDFHIERRVRELLAEKG